MSPSEIVLDAKAQWLFREQQGRHVLAEKILNAFDQKLWTSAFAQKGGSIIVASLLIVPKKWNKQDENKQIRAGKTAEG